MSRGWHQGLGHTRGFYNVAEQQHQQQRGQEGSLGLRSAFRQLQEPSWLTPEAPFQSSQTGEEWGWGHGVNWGPGENWRWQHCDRVPNATDMGPHGGSFQPSYPHWGQQCDWELNGAVCAAGASWNLAQQQQHLDNWRPNDCFQQSLSYSTPTAGYWQELPYHNNASANASMLDTSDRLEDTGMIRSESRSQFQSRCLAFEKEKEKAKVSKEVNAGALKKDRVKILEKNTMSLGDRLAMLEERNPTQCSKKKGKVSSSGAVVPKKKKKKKSKNKVKRLQDTPGQPNKNGEKTEVSKKGKSKIKKLQNMSVNTKLDRNKIFQSLKAAGESIKETVKGQVDKVKNILKPKSKKGAGGQRFSEVISKEGVKVGLTLDPYLMDLSEVEKLQKEEEELFVSTVNWEEDLMLWEEGWGRDFKLKRVNGEEEEEDLRSPHWEDVKEAATDKARKALARAKFSNPVYSDPTNCLTFHGFKGRSCGLANAVPGSFNICEGRRLPLAGAKRKDLDSIDPPTPSKVVKLSDFNQVMQSRYAEYLAKRQKNWVVKSLLETNWLDQLLLSEGVVKEFLGVLKRLKKALQENDNFLQYYSDRKGAFLSQNAALEALDLEETSALSKPVYQTQTVALKSGPEVIVLDSEPDVIVLD